MKINLVVITEKKPFLPFDNPLDSDTLTKLKHLHGCLVRATGQTLSCLVSDHNKHPL